MQHARYRIAAVLAVFLAAAAAVILIIAPSSSATGQACDQAAQTCTLAWVTDLAPGLTTPADASDVTWPQQLATGQDPICGYWLQVDVYRYATPAQRAVVDALLAAGVLNAPGQPGSDSAVVVSWSFTPPATSGCDTPTTTTSPPPTTTTSTTTASIPPATTGTTTSSSHRPSSSSTAPQQPTTTQPRTRSTTARSTSSLAPPTSTSRSNAGARLAETGPAHAWALLALGCAAMIAGIGILVSSRDRRGPRGHR